jgi:hypothetical protein
MPKQYDEMPPLSGGSYKIRTVEERHKEPEITHIDGPIQFVRAECAECKRLKTQLDEAATLVGKRGMEVDELKAALKAGLAVAEKADAEIAALRAENESLKTRLGNMTFVAQGMTDAVILAAQREGGE